MGNITTIRTTLILMMMVILIDNNESYSISVIKINSTKDNNVKKNIFYISNSKKTLSTILLDNDDNIIDSGDDFIWCDIDNISFITYHNPVEMNPISCRYHIIIISTLYS